MSNKHSIYQTLLLLLAILSVVGLYFFGKTTQPLVQNQEGVVSPSEEQMINIDTDSIKLLAIESLTDEEKIAFGNTSKKDLTAFWQSVDQYEMAALSAIEQTQDATDFKTWDIAGDASVRAFREVKDATKQTYFLQKAVSSYQEALENQENVDTKLKLAQIYTNLTGATMEGVLLLREVVEVDPKNIQANYELGLLSVKSGQFDRALERFDTLIQIEPSFIEPYILKAQVLLQLERKEEAIGVLDEAMAKTTNDKGLATLQEMKKSIK